MKALYQQRTARSVRKQADCFTEEALAQAVTGKLRRMERERLADHLMTCSDCAREYRLIQSLKPWAEQVAMRSQEPFSEMRITERQESWAASLAALLEQFLWQPRLRFAAVAATIVIAFGVIAVWRITQPDKEAVSNERGTVSVTMKIEPLNQAVLRESPAQLTWSEPKSAESYQVVLYDFESTPIWESPLIQETSITLPEAIRNGLQRGWPIYWRVIAQDGVQRRQSELFQFTISP